MKQKYRSAPYMDDDVKMNLSICRCVPIIMAVSYIETEEILESVKRIKRSVKQKYSSNPFMYSDCKINLPTCKTMPNVMAPTRKDIEKYHKINETYHKFNEAK